MPQIPALPPMTDPAGPDQFPVDDTSASTTKRMSLTQLSAWLQSLFINLIDAGINLFTIRNETMFNHIVSGGCVLIGTGYGSTRNWSLSSGVVYINGKRFTVDAATGTATASRDTYFDLLEPASGTVATLVNTGANIATLNAASPALAANSVRMGIIVTGAGNILNVGSVNQGEEAKVLPIASSVPYAVTDSLGNLICPRDPNRRILGQKQVIANFTSASAVVAAEPALSCPVIVPLGRKIKASYYCRTASSSSASGYGEISIFDGTVAGATVAVGAMGLLPANGEVPMAISTPAITPTATSKTYCIGKRAPGGGTATFAATAATPAYILIELV